MTSKIGRVLNSWNFPEGLLMKAVAVRLHDQGLRGSALEAEFARLIPHWKKYFARPISDNAVSQRADKGRGYANENPETNPLLRPYWRVAGRIARRGTAKFTRHDIRNLIRQVEEARS